MILPIIEELALLGVRDAGKPNQERILLRPMDRIQIGRFALLIGIRDVDGGATPAPDFFFKFTDLEVFPPARIEVFTGPGLFKESVTPDRRLEFHCGKLRTVFNTEVVIPILIRLDGVAIAPAIAASDEQPSVQEFVNRLLKS